MLQALHAEWQKARRRHDLVLCLAFAVILYLWLGSTAPTGQDELANAYSALFFGAPIINTILLPVLMAVLASRLWDVEVKGYTAKLLALAVANLIESLRLPEATMETLNFIMGTSIAGFVLMVALEAAVLLLLGHTQGYTEAFPAGQFAYLNLCTLTVCTMLYFSELLLALWFSNPLPAVCVGIIGALLGLFSAFMPQIASYFVPWGYFVPLCSYEVKVWDQASHTVLYGTRPCNWGLLVFTFGLAVFLFGVCWRVMCNKEV